MALSYFYVRALCNRPGSARLGSMKPIEQLSSSWLWNHHPVWTRDVSRFPPTQIFNAFPTYLEVANEALMIDLRIT